MPENEEIVVDDLFLIINKEKKKEEVFQPQYLYLEIEQEISCDMKEPEENNTSVSCIVDFDIIDSII